MLLHVSTASLSMLLLVSCGTFSSLTSSDPRVSRTAESAQEASGRAVPEARAAGEQAGGKRSQEPDVARTGRQRVVAFLMADDRDDRLRWAEKLCSHQQSFVDRGADDPAEQAALSWMADFLDPQNERARARTRLGPRNGLRDVYHEPGFEIFVEAGGGLLLFDREGVMIGRIGRESGELDDLGFHDIDGDGQSEIFLAFDSGVNSGNRFTEVMGYKEVGGVLRPVLERRLYQTADRWTPSGLGPRLSTVKLAGQTYVVLRQGSDTEFLRWDASRSQLVVESAPAHRAFLD